MKEFLFLNNFISFKNPKGGNKSYSLTNKNRPFSLMNLVLLIEKEGRKTSFHHAQKKMSFLLHNYFQICRA